MELHMRRSWYFESTWQQANKLRLHKVARLFPFSMYLHLSLSYLFTEQLKSLSEQNMQLKIIS